MVGETFSDKRQVQNDESCPTDDQKNGQDDEIGADRKLETVLVPVGIAGALP